MSSACVADFADLFSRRFAVHRTHVEPEPQMGKSEHDVRDPEWTRLGLSQDQK